MKNIYKKLKWIMFTIVLSLCLVACSAKDVDVNSDNKETQSTTEKSSDIKESESESETKEETASEVLLDENDIYVEYRGIKEYSDSSWIVNLYVENKSASEIYLSLNDELIGGFAMTLSNDGISIPAGSKYLAFPNFDLIIDVDDLKECGITHIDKLSFVLSIKTEMFGDVISETEVNVDVNKTVGESETKEETASEVLLDENDIYVEYRGIKEYSDSSWIVNLYVENKSASEIYLSLNDELIGGFAMTLSNDGISIPAGSKYLAFPNFDLIIDVDDLKEYGITNIESLAFVLSVKTEMFGDVISEVPVSLSIDKPIN